MNKVRLTQRDVARQAGVSQAAVSYVLNGTEHPSVSGETRNRVLKAIDDLGYVPHGVARGMRTGRSMMIGAVIPDITNPFYPAFQRGMQDAAETAGFSLVAFNTDSVRKRELSSIRTALQVGVDGLIVSLWQTTPDDLAIVHARNIPLVVYGSLTGSPAELPYDTLDFDAGLATSQVVRYLAQRGHRLIALIDGPDNITRNQPRLVAYRETMGELQLAIDERLVIRADFSEQGGYQAMTSILDVVPRPSSIVAGNDVIAMGVLARIHEAGLSVPDDIAVVGYDDIPAARLLRPALTTVALHPEHIGSRAVQLLLERLTGAVTGAGRAEFMAHELVIRQSA